MPPPREPVCTPGGPETPERLGDLLVRQASRRPDETAFVHRDERLTFGELAERAQARAEDLRRRGVGPGARVAIAMPAGLRLVETFWSLQLLEAVPCIFNPGVPAATLKRRVDLIAPRLVIDDERASEGAAAVGRSASDDGPPPRDGLAFLQLTSGSSGAPRASMIGHRQALAFLRNSRASRFMRQEDVCVGWVPPWHDLGLVLFVLDPVFRGARCHLITPAAHTIPEWIQTIAEVGGTSTAAPDFALRLAMRMFEPGAVSLRTLRLLICGGEPVRASTLAAFGEHFDCPGAPVPGYGLGEAVLGVSVHLPGEAVPVDERGTISCGWPHSGLEVRAGAGPDCPEEIRVRGEMVFDGYLGAEAETRRALRDGWLHTGDSGYLDAAGRLYVLGRRSGMIKRGGSVLAPRELEEAAQRVPEVGVAAAVGASEPDGGDERVLIAVEMRASAAVEASTVSSSVSAAIRDELGFAPARVVVMPRGAIPRTENGKLRHEALRALLSA